MKQGLQDPIKNEADNGLKNDNYTVAMALTSDPHSATAQFFINVADNDFLNFKAPNASGWGYCVFGKVVEGNEVVDKIKGVKTGSSGFHQDVPKEDVIIERAEVCTTRSLAGSESRATVHSRPAPLPANARRHAHFS